MKTDTHPTVYDAKVTCACGNTLVVPSTKEEISIEICSVCHPFWTGNDRSVDTAGRVERFKARAAKTAEKKPAKKKAA
jgi:large subunit ribosomal protein L31